MNLKEKVFLIITDAVLVLFAIFLAIYIRFEGEVSVRYFYGFEWLFTFVVICCIASFYFFGLYEKLWRYAGIQELKNIFLASVIAWLPVTGAVIATKGEYYSRSIIFISWLLTLFFTGGIRFLLRMIHERMGLLAMGKKALIVGANDAGEAVLREMLRQKSAGYLPVGFIDDDKSKKNIRIHNVPVLGTVAAMADIVQERSIEEIIIALPSPSLIQKVIKECENLKVEFKVVPSLTELISGRMSVNQIRRVLIEDLLEREEIKLDREKMREYIRGKKILVTGAGGSIGSELCRQVLMYDPGELIMLGRGENSIYEISLELKSRTETPLTSTIADIRDERRMRGLLDKFRPDIIFHTAAHKHVPLMEHNVCEAVANNVFGSKLIMELAEEYGVKSFILLSTDKAVNPTSVMGATKRLTEMIMKSFASTAKKCHFSAVRFGNVLDSRGSVVPTFRRQIAMGGPVTVTHEKMTRYFMTIPEAVQLVIEAGAMGQAGEIFILDMGKPVNIYELAQNMIRLSGFEPGKDIPIEVRGIRPGEKLYEELVNTGEETEKTEYEKIQRVITNTIPYSEMEKKLAEMKDILATGNDAAARNKLRELAPNFTPLD
jgi:FlaA1/EpsC-like NDP-sugar epimerase